MKFLKSLFAAVLCIAVLCACSDSKAPKYNLNIISPSYEQMYNLFNESETDKYVLNRSDSWQEYINDETLSLLHSVTIRDDDVSDETAAAIVELCKKKNIPVFFLFNNVSENIMQSYDKAYCINIDYTYIGETFAQSIHDMWTNEIVDKDDNKIFTFTVIKSENIDDKQQIFYDSLLKNIELLGVPLEQLDEVSLTQDQIVDYCLENQNKNESYILLNSSFLPLLSENYNPSGEGVEVIGIDYGTENVYADYSYIKVCFVNYSEFYCARNAILQNIDAKIYPFENLEYDTIDKNVYISPLI